MDPLRLSDADREAAVDQLGEQYAVGRLAKDEFDERSDAVWSAKTRGDLAPVFADLPVRAGKTPARADGRPGRRGRPRGLPNLSIIFLVVAIAVIIKLPFLVFAVLLWFCLSRRGWHGAHPPDPQIRGRATCGGGAARRHCAPRGEI